MLVEPVQVVPWFSMEEWKMVYESIYSDDIKYQHQGYDHLLAWKGRVPVLPAGIECTLGILQVIILDKEQQEHSAFFDQHLRLAYSSAAIRFLNLILEVGDDNGSMYKKAKKLNIPEWIVNMRHDAAHGTTLPDLDLLRDAGQFILNWLHDGYWKEEKELRCDWTVTQQEVLQSVEVKDKLQELVETWEALSLYKYTGFNKIDEIPSNLLRKKLENVNNLVEGDDSEDSSQDVSSMTSLVLRRITRFVKPYDSSVDKTSAIVAMLVMGDLLLPSETFMRVIEPLHTDDDNVLPSPLVEMWADMMSILWELQAMPILLQKLIEIAGDDSAGDHRCKVAALWVQKLGLSCIKVREARKLRAALKKEGAVKFVYAKYYNPESGYSRKESLKMVLMSEIENQNKELSLGFSWRLLPLQVGLFSKDLLIKALHPPSKYASFMLPSLIDLVLPPISLHSRNLLLELADIYNDQKFDGEIPPGSPFSTADLLNAVSSNSEKNIVENEDCDVDLEKTSDSPWQLSQAHLDWTGCALGLLPWQQKMDQTSCNKPIALWKEFIADCDWTISAPFQPSPVLPDSSKRNSIHSVKRGMIQKSNSKKNRFSYPPAMLKQVANAMHININGS